MNPFYRFEDAPAIGSMGERAKTLSYATNEIFQDILASYSPGQFTFALNGFQAVISQYNIDLQANFIVENVVFPPPFSYPANAQVYIYETNLVEQFPLCRISFTCELDSSNIIVSSKLSFLGYLNDNFSYSAPLYDGEKDAYKALENLQSTGSAIFPKWYKYDSSTGIAKSSMARFKDCKFDNTLGRPARATADINPRGNRPIINFPSLDGDAKYILGLFDSLIKNSQSATSSFFSIIDEALSWIIPDGFLFRKYEDVGTYNRAQFNIYKSGSGYGFSLIVREENGFLFQRFYAPEFTLYNLLDDYSEAQDLPYETTSNDRKYADIFYDFEFCVFAECAYPEKESYLMPIKSGDELRFNIEPYQANIIAEQSVDVGLFDENFNLVQKIGSTNISSGFDCCGDPCEMVFELIIPFAGGLVDNLIDSFNEYNGIPNGKVIFTISEEQTSSFVLNDVISDELLNQSITYDLASVVSFLDLMNEISCVEVDNGIKITSTYFSEGFICPNYYHLLFWLEGGGGPFDYLELQGVGTPEQCINQFDGVQQCATAIIPNARSGCYRLGLYNFDSGYNGLRVTYDDNSIITQGVNYVLAIVSPSGIAEYIVGIPNSVSDINDVILYLQTKVPFVNVLDDSTIVQPIYWRIETCPYIGLIGDWLLQIGTYDYATGVLTPIYFEENSFFGCGEEPINEIYAFSNLLYLDNSDCFSSIIQYWAESNAIAEGNEYYGDWYQQVRLGINGAGQKPVISESVYRQSNGVHRRPSNKQDLSIDLHTDFLDFETQCALVDATRHPNFVFNGQSLFVNGDIDVATIQDFSTQTSFEDLAQVKFSALIQGYQPKNSTCVNC